MLKEINTYRGGHTRDVACAVWHPVHEELFSSGSQDGSLVYWLVSRPTPQASFLQRIRVDRGHVRSDIALKYLPCGIVSADSMWRSNPTAGPQMA